MAGAGQELRGRGASPRVLSRAGGEWERACGSAGDGMEADRGLQRLRTVSDDGRVLLGAATSPLPAAWRKGGAPAPPQRQR